MAIFPRRGASWSASGALALAVAMACVAPATTAGPAAGWVPDLPPRDPPTTHLAMGTVVSVTGETLVLRHIVHGRQVSETFRVTAGTQRVGSVQPGVKVTVQYQVDRATKRATFIKAPATRNDNRQTHQPSDPRAKTPSGPTGGGR